MGTGNLAGPLRHFAAQLDELRSRDVTDMDQVGRILVELAADEEFFGPLIAQIPAAAPGDRWLLRPERGPRLVLVHRPEGVMGYTHSHRCWVGIAPVRGVETHQRWGVVRHEDGRAELRLAAERALQRGDVATLVPPQDVHNHGHVAGTGPSPYSLVLLGDDMLLFDREEYDPEQGTWRALAPGNPGRANRLSALGRDRPDRRDAGPAAGHPRRSVTITTIRGHPEGRKLHVAAAIANIEKHVGELDVTVGWLVLFDNAPDQRDRYAPSDVCALLSQQPGKTTWPILWVVPVCRHWLAGTRHTYLLRMFGYKQLVDPIDGTFIAN